MTTPGSKYFCGRIARASDMQTRFRFVVWDGVEDHANEPSLAGLARAENMLAPQVWRVDKNAVSRIKAMLGTRPVDLSVDGGDAGRGADDAGRGRRGGVGAVAQGLPAHRPGVDRTSAGRHLDDVAAKRVALAHVDARTGLLSASSHHRLF